MLIVWDGDGREIIRYAQQPAPELPTAADLEKLAASEPPPPEEIASADELYFTGLHLEQYRHATRSPILYWQEALCRDPGDARCNLAVGAWEHLRRSLLLDQDNLRARAHGAIGNWLYAKRRHAEAIRHWQAAVRLQPDNAVIWRCLGIGLFNISRKPAAAQRAFSQARRFTPENPRLLYEYDQLLKGLGVLPEKRLRLLKAEEHLVAVRDDLTIEFCALLNQCGQPQIADAVLEARRFQPWEGGEGEMLRQYVRANLLLGRQALAEENPSIALDHFQRALHPLPTLGEARHPLANCADIHFWTGEAQSLLGESGPAAESWKRAAEFRGDFQEMSVQSYSELTFDSARALQRLGRKREATRLLRGLLTYAIELEKQAATIDYFATSLPTLLLFDDDLQARQTTKALFLQAQAHLGLGDARAARRLLNDVIRREPGHAASADLLSGIRRSSSEVTSSR